MIKKKQIYNILIITEVYDVLFPAYVMIVSYGFAWVESFFVTRNAWIQRDVLGVSLSEDQCFWPLHINLNTNFWYYKMFLRN